jgi:hypothetical protein
VFQVKQTGNEGHQCMATMTASWNVLSRLIPSRRFVGGLNERFRREGLCQKRNAAGGHRSSTQGRVVVAGHVDHVDGNSCVVETISQFDTGPVVQIDIEDDASCLFDIGTVLESLCGRKQDRFICVLPQQPLMHFSTPGSSSTTKTRLRSFDIPDLSADTP